MSMEPDSGWKTHELEQRKAWLALTHGERLSWLEGAKRFVEQAGRAKKTYSDPDHADPLSSP